MHMDQYQSRIEQKPNQQKNTSTSSPLRRLFQCVKHYRKILIFVLVVFLLRRYGEEQKIGIIIFASSAAVDVNGLQELRNISTTLNSDASNPTKVFWIEPKKLETRNNQYLKQWKQFSESVDSVRIWAPICGNKLKDARALPFHKLLDMIVRTLPGIENYGEYVDLVIVGNSWDARVQNFLKKYFIHLRSPNSTDLITKKHVKLVIDMLVHRNFYFLRARNLTEILLSKSQMPQRFMRLNQNFVHNMTDTVYKESKNVIQQLKNSLMEDGSALYGMSRGTFYKLWYHCQKNIPAEIVQTLSAAQFDWEFTISSLYHYGSEQVRKEFNAQLSKIITEYIFKSQLQKCTSTEGAQRTGRIFVRQCVSTNIEEECMQEIGQAENGECSRLMKTIKQQHPEMWAKHAKDTQRKYLQDQLL